ncbi:MAG: O-antigen ligase family protein [bacterium]|nr:O-antigen ligase family protein [bacterium]
MIIDENKHKKIILVIILSSVVFSVISLFGPEGLGMVFKNYKNDAFTFGNSSFAGMYLFASFLLSIYYLFQAGIKKWWMYFLPILLIINPYILSRDIWFGDFSQGLIGEARASTVVIIFSIFFLIITLALNTIKNIKVKRITFYSIFSVGLISMAVFSTSLLSTDGFVRKVYSSEATEARPIVWDISKGIINKRLFLGWGNDNFERVFEVNYNNKILEGESGGEPWFDRAHNIIIDKLVDNGIIGFSLYILIYISVLLSLIYVILNSLEKKDRVLASVLLVYFPLHFIELQTAFDTTISYPILGFMFISSLVLHSRTVLRTKNLKNEFLVNENVKYVIAFILLIFFIWSFTQGLIPSIRTQITNGYIRTVGSAEKRIPEYKTLFNSPIDTHSFLWRTATDFQRGIGENPKVLENPANVEFLKKEIFIIENEYRKYIKANPTHFRAHLNLADVLIYERLFNIDKLKEAQEVLDTAIKLVPQSPQSYWMKAVAYIYMRKFDLAREYAKKGMEINPNIKESEEVVKYVEESIKSFPEINLFFFKQI